MVKEDVEGSGRVFRGEGRMLRRSGMVLMGSGRTFRWSWERSMGREDVERGREGGDGVMEDV